MTEHLAFAALLALFAGPLAYAFGPDDLAQLRCWWTEKRQEDARPCWAPGELPVLTRQLAGEREWARRFVSRRDQLVANRRLRAAGYSAALAGRAERLP